MVSTPFSRLPNVSGSIRCMAPSVGSVTYSGAFQRPSICGRPLQWSVCSWVIRMPSMWSTVLSTAARRASVSRLPRPASMRRRVRSVSSNVILPELPDARMDTRKPIASPSDAARVDILCPTRIPNKIKMRRHLGLLACGVARFCLRRASAAARRRAPRSLGNGNGDILPPRTMEKYDLIVVGSGPGGQRAAIQAAKFGKRAALIEKLEVIGGTAINTGTIPSKTIREAVLHLSGYQYQSIYGVNYRVKEQITMADLSFRALNVIKTEIDVIRAQLSRNGIEVVTGTASFLDPHHMQVTSSRGQVDFEAGNIVIATGTKPAVSPLVPFNDTTIINSDQILKMPVIPKAMIVVGGGVIGVEYVCMFATLGVRVTLIEKRPRLLEFADAEMVEALCYHLRDRRVTLRLNEEVESVEETPDHTVVANLKSKKKVTGDALLYAVGRQGNVDELNLAAGGLEADARGRIPVDENYQTKQPHVYAVGDVIGFPSLGSVSMEQGRIAAARAFGMPTNSNRANYPYGIYTIPEISFIGKTEEQLTEEGVPNEVGMAFFREIARGQIRGDTTGRLKLLFDPSTKELLGVHIIGEGASELLHIGQAVFALKGTVEYFVDTVFNYPTLAECYKAAAFNGLNKLVRA